MKQLEATHAFSPGSTLWILGSLEQSAWTRKLDWYLNLQLLRAKPHQKRELAAPLKRILKDQEWEEPPIEDQSEKPLMIAAGRYVPAEQVIVLSETDAKKWLTRAQHVWSKLGKPQVRLFTPPFVSPAQAQAQWQGQEGVTVVADPTKV